MRFVRDNGLSLFFGALLLATLVGQSFAGQHAFNAEAVTHHEPTYSWLRFVTSSEFGGDVMENWQSEFLQFTLYILTTIWLMQRGSSESKNADELGLMSDQSQLVGPYAQRNSPAWAKAKGLKLWIYSNSLVLAMAFCFFASWFVQSVTDWRAFNNDQLAHHVAPITWASYWVNPDFWNRSLQNWQSEFLAIGSMAIFAVFLRQRGSSESKPVGAPHGDTESN